MSEPCVFCGAEIAPERADFLRDVRKPMKCMSCSGERPKAVFMEYGHKTAGSLVVVGNDPEQIRLARRAYKRER